MRESKHIGDIVVDLVEAFARVEERKLTIEYSSRGYISGFRNNAGLTVPYYSNIMTGIGKDQNTFFLSILAVPSLAAYVLTDPLTFYRGIRCLLKEIVKRAVLKKEIAHHRSNAQKRSFWHTRNQWFLSGPVGCSLRSGRFPLECQCFPPKTGERAKLYATGQGPGGKHCAF